MVTQNRIANRFDRITRLACRAFGVPIALVSLVDRDGHFNLDSSPPNLVVQVEFAALDYSSPERNLYQYQLEGYDPGWIDTNSTRRLATYTNLPPGSYQLICAVRTGMAGGATAL